MPSFFIEIFTGSLIPASKAKFKKLIIHPMNRRIMTLYSRKTGENNECGQN